MLMIVTATICQSGCATVVSSAAMGLADNLSKAIMNQNDPETVEGGAPSYLLLMDAMIEGEPANPDVLMAGAKLYAAYAGVFVGDPERARRLSTRARTYSRTAVCLELPEVCKVLDKPHAEFAPVIAKTAGSDIDLIYSLAITWAGWVQTHRDDWNAVADLPKIRECMQHIVKLDTNYDNGGPHLYLGLMNSLVPAALGGKPEVGRSHFEEAIRISRGENLMIKVQYAEQYARLVFDRELHDRLLKEVMEAEADVPGLTLFNTLAKRRAKILLEQANDYF